MPLRHRVFATRYNLIPFLVCPTEFPSDACVRPKAITQRPESILPVDSTLTIGDTYIFYFYLLSVQEQGSTAQTVSIRPLSATPPSPPCRCGSPRCVACDLSPPDPSPRPPRPDSTPHHPPPHHAPRAIHQHPPVSRVSSARPSQAPPPADRPSRPSRLDRNRHRAPPHPKHPTSICPNLRDHRRRRRTTPQRRQTMPIGRKRS